MQPIEYFLKEIEQRAFRIAMLATRSEADALDLVQEAMIKLVNKYSDRKEAEWKPLFLKILENGILDWHRKEKVRRALFFWKNDDNSGDAETEGIDENTDPLAQLDSQQQGESMLKEIESLPLKQQQCFLLRAWEGMSVKETAEIMGVNEGSVKTHYFRAMEKLRSMRSEIS